MFSEEKTPDWAASENHDALGAYKNSGDNFPCTAYTVTYNGHINALHDMRARDTIMVVRRHLRYSRLVTMIIVFKSVRYGVYT